MARIGGGLCEQEPRASRPDPNDDIFCGSRGSGEDDGSQVYMRTGSKREYTGVGDIVLRKFVPDYGYRVYQFLEDLDMGYFNGRQKWDWRMFAEKWLRPLLQAIKEDRKSARVLLVRTETRTKEAKTKKDRVTVKLVFAGILVFGKWSEHQNPFQYELENSITGGVEIYLRRDMIGRYFARDALGALVRAYQEEFPRSEAVHECSGGRVTAVRLRIQKPVQRENPLVAGSSTSNAERLELETVIFTGKVKVRALNASTACYDFENMQSERVRAAENDIGIWSNSEESSGGGFDETIMGKLRDTESRRHSKFDAMEDDENPQGSNEASQDPTKRDIGLDKVIVPWEEMWIQFGKLPRQWETISIEKKGGKRGTTIGAAEAGKKAGEKAGKKAGKKGDDEVNNKVNILYPPPADKNASLRCAIETAKFKVTASIESTLVKPGLHFYTFLFLTDMLDEKKKESKRVKWRRNTTSDSGPTDMLTITPYEVYEFPQSGSAGSSAIEHSLEFLSYMGSDVRQASMFRILLVDYFTNEILVWGKVKIGIPGESFGSRIRSQVGSPTRSGPPPEEEMKYESCAQRPVNVVGMTQDARGQHREQNSGSFRNVAVTPVTASSESGQGETHIDTEDSALTRDEECETTGYKHARTGEPAPEDNDAMEGESETEDKNSTERVPSAKRPRTAEDLIGEFTVDQEVASIIGQLAENTVSVNPYDDDSIKEDSAPF